MARLSNRPSRLAPSATFAMSQKSGEMKAQDIDVIDMSAEEPDFNTPDHTKVTAKQAVSESYSKYSPVPGYPDLRKAITKRLQKENQLSYDTAAIMVSNGARQSVCNTLMTLVDDGDEVIIPAPYWMNYPQMVRLAGGDPVIVRAGFEQNFKMTPERSEAAITSRARILMLCSPNNPTRSVCSEEELGQLANVIKRHEDMFMLADKIYEHINYVDQHESIAQFPRTKERTILTNGVSKTHAMTGRRIEYIAASEWIVKGCNRLQGQYTSGPCSVGQRATLAAYVTEQACVEEIHQAFQRKRDLIVRLAEEIGGFEMNEPQGAFYLFLECSSYFGKSDGQRTINSATDLAMYLLETAHVAIVDGDAFGDSEYIRMSYATNDKSIREALKRMEDALARLK